MDNDWKKEAPKLAAMGKVNSFSVPEGYFNNLPGQINSQVFLSELHPGNATGKFIVPDGYFEGLTGQIEGRIVVEKLKEEFVDTHFTVPEGYFSKLQDQINAKVAEPAKVISIWPRKRLAWISYAAAACTMLGVVSTVLYFNIPASINATSSVSVVKTNAANLSSLSDDDIIGYLKIHSTRADMPVIIENLQTVVTPDITTDLSEDEVQEYLNKNL